MIKTVSLELAKQLKEAGFPQETAFSWVKPKEAMEYVLWHERQLTSDEVKDWDDIAAPTAEEILDELPWKIEKIWKAPNGNEIKDWYLEIYKHDFDKKIGNSDKWNIVYSEGQVNWIHLSDQSLAEAAGKMYIYLKKQGLLKGEDPSASSGQGGRE